MTTLVQQFDMLGRKQLAFQDAINMLDQTKAELFRNANAATAWGSVAVFANVVLVPLNVIVNGMELKGVNTLYQSTVKTLYSYFASSGSRNEGVSKHALKLLKEGINKELLKRGLTTYVPGVNIIVGLAEDSIAMYQSLLMLQSGKSEQAVLIYRLNHKITVAQIELRKLGIARANIFEQLQRTLHTA